MKRLFALVPVLALALALGGCQTGTIGTILSGSLKNPVTPTAAAVLHNSFLVGVIIPAGRYASLPRCSRHAPPCSQQKVVNGLRKYINPAAAALNRLDIWAAGNTSLDGPALYKAATDLVQAAKDFGQANAVPGIQ